jgi:ABC-2 type transport system permease protein
MLLIVFVAPLVQLLILGYAANLDVQNIPMVVVDNDRSQSSRELVDRFIQSGYFSVAVYAQTDEVTDRYLDRGDAGIALVIPSRFGNDVLANNSPQIQLIVDGSETTTATSAMNYASMIVARYSDTIATEVRRKTPVGADPPRIVPEIRIWYNPELRSRNFMVPGIVGLLLMVVTINLTSLAIVKEREIGTFEQIIVTPIRPSQYLAGKLLPFTVIGMLDVILVVSAALLLFSIPVKGSMILLFGVSMIFLMTTLGLGLFVSTVSRTQQQAMMTSVFFIMLPMIYLSGFVFPIENMPSVFQYVSYALPLRYFFVMVRGVFLKGIGLAELWDQVLMLTLFGTAILALSVARFRKTVG